MSISPKIRNIFKSKYKGPSKSLKNIIPFALAYAMCSDTQEDEGSHVSPNIAKDPQDTVGSTTQKMKKISNKKKRDQEDLPESVESAQPPEGQPTDEGSQSNSGRNKTYPLSP